VSRGAASGYEHRDRAQESAHSPHAHHRQVREGYRVEQSFCGGEARRWADGEARRHHDQRQAPQNPRRGTSYTIGARGAASQARPTPRWLQETATTAVMPPGCVAATHCQKGCVKGPQATQSPTEGVARPREACGERAERVLTESRRSTRSASERARNASAPSPSARPRCKNGCTQVRKRLPTKGSEEVGDVGELREICAETHTRSMVVRTKRQSASKCCQKSAKKASEHSALCLRRGVRPRKGSSQRGESPADQHRTQRFSGAPLSAGRRLS